MKKKKILIIDDFVPLLNEIAEFLSFENFLAYKAKDGAEGIQMAIQHNPDLIICDIEMPVMDGYEVYKTLEKIPSTAFIPFIFLTAKAQVEDFKKGLKLGADDYITKPMNLDVLLRSIRKRLMKHERIMDMNKTKFEILLKNPLVGIFIYAEDQFIITNKKFNEITGYTKKELNSLKLKDIIIGNKDSVLSRLNNCLLNVHESVQLKLSFIKKDKKAGFIELFVKYIEMDSKNALIGSINKLDNETRKPEELSYSQNPKNEFRKMIDYLILTGKNDIANQIINVKEILSFEDETDILKIKKEINITKRETEILHLICEGYTNSEIAEKLFISFKTVDNHRTNLLSKTGTKNTAALVAFSFKNNLIKF